MTSVTTVMGVQAPVLVRTDVPGKPLAWIDPTPHQADEDGHVWTFNRDEPCTEAFCLLCCNEVSTVRAGERCAEAELIIIVNDCRDRWIAEHRVEECQS